LKREATKNTSRIGILVGMQKTVKVSNYIKNCLNSFTIFLKKVWFIEICNLLFLERSDVH